MSDYPGGAAARSPNREQSAFVDAVTQFGSGVARSPRDPVALSGLGFAALRAGDLVRTRTATEHAGHDQDRALLAASLYNLGLLSRKPPMIAMQRWLRTKSLADAAKIGRGHQDDSQRRSQHRCSAAFRRANSGDRSLRWMRSAKRSRKGDRVLPAPFSTETITSRCKTLTSPPPHAVRARRFPIRPPAAP